MNDSRLEGTLNGSHTGTAHANGHPVAGKIDSQAAALHQTGRPTRAGLASSAPTAPPTWSGCAARCRRSTRWPGSAPSGCGRCCSEDDYVNALGALTGNQAVQQVKAGLKAIYLSGWQVAADANLAGQTYPDQSLYPANSVPAVVRRINNALLRADQITWAESRNESAPHWLAPIVADAEAGFGGVLNAFELMKAMIAAGAAGVHWEDQLASEKKCGHLGGKVLIPTGQHIKTLNAARLAADVCGVPTPHRRPHRRPGRDADHQRRRRAGRARSSPASAPPRASTGCATASSRASPAAWPTRRTPTCCGWRPQRRTWRSPASSPRRSRPSTRTRCWPTTARRRSTGGRTWTTAPSRSSSASSARWATSSSSSRWPASTR